MANQPKTAQGWAWYYLRNRLGAITGLLELSENLPKVLTFADLKEGEFFIRFPWADIKNGELIFKNTELYRKIGTVKQMQRPESSHIAMGVITGSPHEIPDDEPVVVIK